MTTKQPLVFTASASHIVLPSPQPFSPTLARCPPRDSCIGGPSLHLAYLLADISSELAVVPGAFSAVFHYGRILEKAPPSVRLSQPAVLHVDSPLLLTSLSSPVITTHSHSCSTETNILSPSGQHSLSQSTCNSTKMPQKRRSLQSIFAPSFSPTYTPQSPTFPIQTRLRSHSLLPTHTLRARPSRQPRTPPPPDLLGDDPFANLSPAPCTSCPRSPLHAQITEPATAAPRSALSSTKQESPPQPISAPSTPALPLCESSSGIVSPGSVHSRPAHKKPAFASRPSLPSLDTLARMNLTIPKVRRGTVGARLPHEPWDTSATVKSSQSHDGYFVPQASDSDESTSLHSAGFLPALEFDAVDFSNLPNIDQRISVSRDLPSAVDDNIFFYAFSDPSEEKLSMLDSDDPSTPLSNPSLSALFSYTPSRAASSTSGSSSGSSVPEEDSPSQLNYDHFRHMTATVGSGHVQSSSAESESDPSISPVDEYFFFPSSRYSSDSSVDSHEDDRSFPIDLCITPHNSMYSVHDTFDLTHQPGTSANTIRAGSRAWARSESPFFPGSWKGGEVVDGTEQGEIGQRGHSERWYNGSSSTTSSGDGVNGDMGGGGYLKFNEGHGRGGDDDGEEGGDDRRGRITSSFSTPTSSDVSTSDEEDSTDEYMEDAGSPVLPAPRTASGSDDDVPLAKRIPTALSAQQTIRRKVREERDQRRKERAAKAEQKKLSRSRQSTLRPAGAGDSRHQQTALSSSREAALHALNSVKRERTQTLPGIVPRPFAPEDLSKKLANVQLADLSVHHKPQNDRRPSTLDPSFEKRKGSGRTQSDLGPGHNLQSTPPNPGLEGGRALQPMRSLRRSEDRQLDEYRSVPLPGDAGAKAVRSATTVSRPRQATRDGNARVQGSVGEPTMNPHRTSEERGKSTRPDGESGTTVSEPGHHHSPRPSLHRSPNAPPHADLSMTKNQTTQQRIFIADVQRFNVVEVTPTTNAAEVLEMMEALGSLKGWVGSGEWMLWEVAQDFGMERPIRNFELLSDIQASWNKDKLVNMFMAKLTPLASLLSRSAIPTSSPKFAGYVEWEIKRGKWTKRWMQLREHSLWLSKRDNGKDEVCLCSLSGFDAYFVTRLHKAPKPFMFAMKSTDNLSYFENTADYLHVFSCSQQDGDKWMENILLARSYVLHQERHVLFNPRNSNGGTTGSNAVLRSGTKKATSSHRPAQPLVNVAAPFNPTSDVFEPGSLLYKQT